MRFRATLVFAATFACGATVHADANGRAARALNDVATELSALDHTASPRELMTALRRAKSDRPVAHALRVENDAAGEARWRAWQDELSAHFYGPILCGEARTETHLTRVCAEESGAIEISADGHLRISLDAHYQRPRVLAVDAGGVVTELGREDLLHSAILLDAEQRRGPLAIQVLAEAPDGPHPVAEVCLGGCPTWPNETDAHAAITHARALVHTGPLRPNALLDRVAAKHAEDVCGRRHVAHELAPGETPVARVHRAGIEARVVGETIARAEDRDASLRALLESPSHRSTLIDRRFTDVGVGHAQSDDAHECTVVVLAAWPRLLTSH